MLKYPNRAVEKCVPITEKIEMGIEPWLPAHYVLILPCINIALQNNLSILR